MKKKISTLTALTLALLSFEPSAQAQVAAAARAAAAPGASAAAVVPAASFLVPALGGSALSPIPSATMSPSLMPSLPAPVPVASAAAAPVPALPRALAAVQPSPSNALSPKRAVAPAEAPLPGPVRSERVLAALFDGEGEQPLLLKSMARDAKSHLLAVAVGGSTAYDFARRAQGASLRRMGDGASASARRVERVAQRLYAVEGLGLVTTVTAGVAGFVSSIVSAPFAYPLAAPTVMVAAFAVAMVARALARRAAAMAVAPRALAAYARTMLARRAMKRQKTISPRVYMTVRTAAFLKSNREKLEDAAGVRSVALRRGGDIAISIDRAADKGAVKRGLLLAVPELAGHPVALRHAASRPVPRSRRPIVAAALLLGVLLSGLSAGAFAAVFAGTVAAAAALPLWPAAAAAAAAFLLAMLPYKAATAEQRADDSWTDRLRDAVAVGSFSAVFGFSATLAIAGSVGFIVGLFAWLAAAMSGALVGAYALSRIYSAALKDGVTRFDEYFDYDGDDRRYDAADRAFARADFRARGELAARGVEHHYGPHGMTDKDVEVLRQGLDRLGSAQFDVLLLRVDGKDGPSVVVVRGVEDLARVKLGRASMRIPSAGVSVPYASVQAAVSFAWRSSPN